MICQLVVNPQTGKPLDEGMLKKHFPREIASSTVMAEASRRSPWSERHRIGGLSRRAVGFRCLQCRLDNTRASSPDLPLPRFSVPLLLKGIRVTTYIKSFGAVLTLILRLQGGARSAAQR
jgi:hypothetical protein